MQQYIEPKENDSIDCHLQQIGMGGLVCRAARQTGEKTTNDVNAEICLSCECGKIYREIGCDAVTPKIRIFSRIHNTYDIESLFCKIRKRNTTMDYCKSCDLVTAETTRNLVTVARGLFTALGYHTAYQDLEKAREAVREGNFENAVTRSISCVESVLKICHERGGVDLPNKKQITDLWKSARSFIPFDKVDQTGSSTNLINALSGVVSNLGSLRNALGDAHGKSLSSQSASESIAELAINTASTLATFIIRSFNQSREKGTDE